MHDLICQLFTARDAAHELHLKTRSFAAHMALGDLYEELIELADDLAEAYQGKYGLIDMGRCQVLMSWDKTSPVAFIQQLAGWAETSRSAFSPADTNLLNDWDNVISLIYKTKYKLENLA
jgi:hypothetical protein